MTSLTNKQTQVLNAAVDLVNGGLDMEEALFCYKTISNYVLNSIYKEPTTTMERAMNGDATAAKQFLHEAGFTDQQGQWLPQYQPIPEAQWSVDTATQSTHVLLLPNIMVMKAGGIVDVSTVKLTTKP